MAIDIHITVLTGVSAGDVFHFPLEVGSSVIIGRATECDLVLQDPLVSRRHIEIQYLEEGFFISDLGSTHGTFHMGFHVQPGSEGKRLLAKDDEFKIGELLFRVSFDDQIFRLAKQEKISSAEGENKESRSKELSASKLLKNKRLVSLLGLALVGGVALMLMPAAESGIPPQKSSEVLIMPNFGVVGYWRSLDPNRATEKDWTHLDKAQFELPATSVVIDYYYTGRGPLDLKIDEALIEQLPAAPESWAIKQLIVRGLALGVQRRLIFDNPDYPRAGATESSLKRWAVKDVRTSPLTSSYGIEPGFDNHLRSAITLAEAMDQTPDGLFLLLRSLQTAAVELLNELKVDALAVSVDLGSDESVRALESTQLKQRLEAIQKERFETAAQSGMSHLKELAALIGIVDAELWRRVNSRISQAKLAVKIKDSIGAHDELLAAMSMFPAEADHRWTLANRLFMNPKAVPARVREKPEKYRKRKNS